MKMIDVLTSPWAIVPEKLYEIQEVYSTHLRGAMLDASAIEAAMNKKLSSSSKNFQVVNGVAVIQIHGIIAKRMNLLTRISGGVSSELAAKDIKFALSDSEINQILLDIDSPGGTVDGTQELADIIYHGRDKKPIVAFSDGLMGSAAYWIGSAANKIYISGDTVQTGSIGVVASHVDYSQYEKKRGIKTTEIYAGKYKRMASQYKPLSKEGKTMLQDRVDYLYTIFVDEIAKHRGVRTEIVLENMADGKVFIGKQGIAAGLVDGVSTFDRLIKNTSAIRSGTEGENIQRELNRFSQESKKSYNDSEFIELNKKLAERKK
ncbi:MAG: hypothetical protein SRB2_02138 [Desulfobacteraceae bacterium Eth-SRB2]|nr:MAG: hypothetical protein SRB2_02138 [Desulfobacteraceae bacterium Eth-SRB2]